MRLSSPNSSAPRNSRQRGYMLLILMFIVALLTFSMMAVLPRVAQQVKRDREEEMIHRGTEYARAIKRYYHKFKRYPNSLQDLENTNNVRYIRRRYQDPFSKDGNWRLLHITDVQQGISNPNFGVSQANNFNPTAGGPNGPGAATSPFGGAPPGATGFTVGTVGQSGLGTPSTGLATGGTAAGGTAAGGTSGGSPNDPNAGPVSPENTTAQTGPAPSPGPNTPANPATGGQTGQTYGAGGIVGVASMSKAKSIREVAKKANYNKWMFIYDPTQDRGTLLKGPYDPQAFIGGNAGGANGVGGNAPAGPRNPEGCTGLNCGGNGSGFGGQQPTSGGPQSNMPPDQNAPPQ